MVVRYLALILAIVALVLLIVLIFGFSSAFRAGVSNLWRVLEYYLPFILISLGLLLVIGAP